MQTSEGIRVYATLASKCNENPSSVTDGNAGQAKEIALILTLQFDGVDGGKLIRQSSKLRFTFRNYIHSSC